MTIVPPQLGFFQRYQPESGAWDECFTPNGRVRPAYTRLVESLEAMDLRTFQRRWEEGQKAIRDNGLTFHGIEQGDGTDRPFRLDPLPFVIDEADWARIERGVAQRARLLDRVIGDVYGERRLLERGLIPPGAIFGHPSFLRPAVKVPVPGGVHLHVYAVDLVRAPDGAFRVVADHAQTPPGAGFALENRIVLSRMLPEAFQAVHTERLAGFFVRMRRMLAELAPRHRDNPRAVLVTPGTLSQSYLEQAYLAQYLGMTLAQGDDLTVRDGRVFLKTLGGLEPVDVIHRRLADDYSDPLDLRNDSQLGTVGLMSAIRAGNVAVANAIGSGVVESSALLPYLDRLCTEEFGEAPALESVRATWLGDHPNPAELLDGDILVRDAFSHRGRPVDPASLTPEQRANLRSDVLARPHAYVAQRKLRPSTVPVWDEGQIVPRPLALRLFAVRDGDGYSVMPGGLARIGRDNDAALAFAEKGGSKDVWVVARGQVSEVSMLRLAEAPVELRRGGIDLPSRIADHLFWLGRYAERIEGTARVLRAALQAAADAGSTTDRALAPFIKMLQALGADVPSADESAIAYCIKRVTGADDGLLPALREPLRRNGSSVRDRLSGDTFRVLLDLDGMLAGPSDDLDANEALSRVSDVVRACAALSGMGQENMTRGPSFRFFDLGRRIDRAVFTCEILGATLPTSPLKPAAATREDLDALLRVADSVITYRSRYLSNVQAAPVVDMLLTDASNPRAIAFQIARIAEHVADLPQESKGALPTLAERLSMRLVSAITLTDPTALVSTAEGDPIVELSRSLAADLEALSDVLATTYLSHALPSRSLAALAPMRGDP